VQCALGPSRYYDVRLWAWPTTLTYQPAPPTSTAGTPSHVGLPRDRSNVDSYIAVCVICSALGGCDDGTGDADAVSIIYADTQRRATTTTLYACLRRQDVTREKMICRYDEYRPVQRLIARNPIRSADRSDRSGPTRGRFGKQSDAINV